MTDQNKWNQKVEQAAKRNADGNGPGTPGGRFFWLMKELEKRFPDPKPFSAEAPEGRYLDMIDEMIKQQKLQSRA